MQNWLNLVAGIIVTLIGLIYRDMRKQIAQSAKSIEELRKEVRTLSELHGLLLGFVPGASGGMVDDVKMLKGREREMTAEMLEIKLKHVLLEKAIITQMTWQRPKLGPGETE